MLAAGVFSYRHFRMAIVQQSLFWSRKPFDFAPSLLLGLNCMLHWDKSSMSVSVSFALSVACCSEGTVHDQHAENGGGEETPSVEVSSSGSPVLPVGQVPTPAIASATPNVPTSVALTGGNGDLLRQQPEAVLDSPAVMAGKRNRKVSHKYADDEPSQVRF